MILDSRARCLSCLAESLARGGGGNEGSRRVLRFLVPDDLAAVRRLARLADFADVGKQPRFLARRDELCGPFSRCLLLILSPM